MKMFVLSTGDGYIFLKLTVSVEFFIRIDPFHHVMTGAGRDPTTSHNSSCSVPADKGLFSPCIFTHNGRTEILLKRNLYKVLFHKLFLMYYISLNSL